ncbi:DinB family protein [Deinococcus sp.]|uniref:DinB family protein n=1 Tax=Deinococcus sp. TaxID=47478 RepID=UPI003C7EB3FF
MTDLAFLVQQTRRMRHELLSFLAPLPAEVLTASPPEYGQGSILKTLTHVADCYVVWVGRTLLEDHWASAETPDDLPALIGRFARVDALLERALTCPRMESGAAFDCVGMENDCVDTAGNRRQVTARWLVLHPTTHEFHHKGQVVTLLHKLGHPVTVDLDLPPPGGW